MADYGFTVKELRDAMPEHLRLKAQQELKRKKQMLGKAIMIKLMREREEEEERERQRKKDEWNKSWTGQTANFLTETGNYLEDKINEKVENTKDILQSPEFKEQCKETAISTGNAIVKATKYGGSTLWWGSKIAGTGFLNELEYRRLFWDNSMNLSIWGKGEENITFSANKFIKDPSKGMVYLTKGWYQRKIDSPQFGKLMLQKLAKKVITDGVIDKVYKTPIDIIKDKCSEFIGHAISGCIFAAIGHSHLALNISFLGIHAHVSIVHWAAVILGWLLGIVLVKFAEPINKLLFPGFMKYKKKKKELASYSWFSYNSVKTGGDEEDEKEIDEEYTVEMPEESELERGAALLFGYDLEEIKQNKITKIELKKKLQGMTEKELTKKWHKLCKKYHPDKGGDTKQFQELQKVYDQFKLCV